ncbi:hypothetical protein BH24CHL6_BH24CHL6_15400 [soil metagenome]
MTAWAKIAAHPKAQRRLSMFVAITVSHSLGALANDYHRLPLRVELREQDVHVTLAGRSLGSIDVLDLFA